MNRLAACLLALALAGCATRAPHPEAFSFGVLGDTPYSDNETVGFLNMIDAMNQEPLAFVVHVGDMKAGSNSPCTDALYVERKGQFDRFKHPFHFIPGDNDWVDCRRKTNGAMDPLERLEKLRAVFYGGPLPTGARALPMDRHPDHPEVARWTRNGVVFATLNVQGSNDNVGFDAASQREQQQRQAVNLAWLREAARLAEATNAHALVAITHANPFEESPQRVYDPLINALVDIATSSRRPLLFINGDTHWQRVDRPFKDANGKTVENLTRAESYGSPWVGWLRITVDPGAPELFSFEPRPQ
jgi:hypothetical protein